LAETGRGWRHGTRHLTITETASLLRIGERTVYEMLRTGRIPGAAKVGGKWRINEPKLTHWMAAGAELADEGSGER
jgi:excisionase family DNA binding protein